jgi:co-chaperonin GroES (HSP10)
MASSLAAALRGGVLVRRIEQGRVVLFGRHSGIDVKIDGEDLLILPEHEFLVVLT